MIRYLKTVGLVILALTVTPLYADGTVEQEVTVSSAAEFGKEMAQAMRTRNLDTLYTLFDMDSFAEKAARTMTDDVNEIRNFAAGFKDGVNTNEYGLFTGLLADPNSRISFIRVLDKNKPVLRLDQAAGGSGYFYFLLERKNDRIVASDFYIYANNRLISEQVGKVTALMMKPSDSLIRKMFGVEVIDKDLVSKIQNITKYKIAGQPLEALKVIESLPEKIRDSEIMLLAAIELAPLEDPRYEKLTNKYIEVLGEDKVANLMLIDYYFFKNEFEKAAQAVMRLENQLGGSDDFTSLLKANVSFFKEDYSESVKIAETAIKNGHVSDDLYWSMLNSHVLLKDYTGAVKDLMHLESDYEYAFSASDFAEEAIWSDFMQSDEFKAYFKDR